MILILFPPVQNISNARFTIYLDLENIVKCTDMQTILHNACQIINYTLSFMIFFSLYWSGGRADFLSDGTKNLQTTLAVFERL